MDQNAFMRKLEELIEDSRAGVLATVDAQGRARMRWLTPTVIKGRAGAIYAMTTPGTRKALDLQDNSKVEWMIQNRALTEVVNVVGVGRIIDNPALKTEVMEILGKRLTVFWKVNIEKREFVVLETVLEEAVYFRPMAAERVRVTFKV